MARKKQTKPTAEHDAFAKQHEHPNHLFEDVPLLDTPVPPSDPSVIAKNATVFARRLFLNSATEHLTEKEFDNLMYQFLLLLLKSEHLRIQQSFERWFEYGCESGNTISAHEIPEIINGNMIG